MILFLSINIILSFVNANHFTKFHVYSNLTISNQSQLRLQLSNSIQVSKLTADKSCMLACSFYSDCAAATIEQNICTLFNNQTVLFDTIYSHSTKLFSKNKLKNCSDDFYADWTAMVCQAKKLYGTSCLSTEECMSSAGLECFNGSCQCLLPDYKYNFGEN